MKTIGIIGGNTHLVTAAYYDLINSHVREELGGLNTGNIIVNSKNMERMSHFAHNELWDEGAEFLHNQAKSLERAGADFLICVSNTWHRVSDKFMAGINLPLLHIAEPTAKAIKDQGLTHVALLGTKATMATPYLPDLFSEQHGLTITVPNEEQMDFMDGVIAGELANGKFTDASKEKLLDIIDELVARGAQGVILGCTDIPLLVSQTDRPKVPMFDTLRLHAKAAAMKSVYE